MQVEQVVQVKVTIGDHCKPGMTDKTGWTGMTYMTKKKAALSRQP
jgi:hypothetical protein